MKHRKLLLAAVAGAGILAAFASQALPLDALRFNGTFTDVAEGGLPRETSRAWRR